MDQFAKLLNAIGVDPITGLAVGLVVTVGIAAIRAFHTLSVGSHSRRKEFLDSYEKICAGSADALAFETVIRHHFGIWIPAKAIERIRQSPSPYRRLLALDGRLEFLDFNEEEGTFTVKAWCADERKRRKHVFLRTFLYVFFIFASLFVIGLFGGVSTLPIIVKLVLAPMFFVSAIYFLDNGSKLKKLSDITRQFPDLFGTDTNPVRQVPDTTQSSSAHSSPSMVSRWMRWTKSRFSATQSATHQPDSPEVPARISRPTSAASTPRA